MTIISQAKPRNDNGFTLIELAIVMIISAFTLIAAFQAYDLYKKDAETRVTNEAIERVDAAINKYFATNGRLPCPSDPAKRGTYRGREWGRDREIGTEVGNGMPYDPSFPDRKQVWADGKDGPVSDAYCKDLGISEDGDADGDGVGDAYAKCLATGRASICKMEPTIENLPDPDLAWPSTSRNQDDGTQQCGNGINGAALTNTKPTRTACTATGERKDDSVDTDYGADTDGDGNKKNDFVSASKPSYDDGDTKPEEISCSRVNGDCTFERVQAQDIAAGGDGKYNSDPTSDGIEMGVATRDLSVLIGGVPFYDLNLPEVDALDGFGNPMRYAVTRGLTRKDGFDSRQTGIVVASQVPGKSSPNMPQSNAQYVIVSFGKNATDEGFYDAVNALRVTITTSTPAVIESCKGKWADGGPYTNSDVASDGYIENENCDVDATFISSLGKSIDWAGTGTPAKSYYDDTVVSDVSSTSSSLWVEDGVNIYNTNSGNVGVNEEAPLSKLDVGNDSGAGAGNTNMQGDLMVEPGRLICQGAGSDPLLTGSYNCNGTGLEINDLIIGTTCPPGQVLSKIRNGGKIFECINVPTPAGDITCPPSYGMRAYLPGSTPKVQCIERTTGNCSTCNPNGQLSSCTSGCT